MPTLAVNIDHVATLRQARLGIEPDPVAAATRCELSGAAGIIVHLREDRRHIQDRDVELLAECVKTELHLEMAATDEMQDIALKNRPGTVCLVPEKREELTTEGGLGVQGREKELAGFLEPLIEAGISTSLFIDPDPSQVEAARATGTEFVELHTGAYAEAKSKEMRQIELARLLDAILFARENGLKVNLGHGLNYTNILSFAKVPGISQYSIGHAIVSRAVMIGLERAVRDMSSIIHRFAE
jgi:pyridoxine 5-phosphate synthase